MGLIAPKMLGASSQNGFTTEQLLQIAKLEGGAVGEVAEELTHPERSIGATVSDRLKRSFSGLVEILTAPNQAVAGIIDPTITIGEAVKKNINVSDVLLGDKPKDLSLSGKVGSFIGRTAIDVLFDPLTYITFGTGRGLVGAIKGMEIYAGSKLAATQGVKAGDTLVLNKVGEDLADKFVQAKRNGLRATFIKNKELELINSGKSLDEAKSILDKLEDSVTDSEVAETFGKRFSRSDAGESIAKMLEKHPALAETYLDKGGVKVFGQTILEGQRIARTIKAIPYFTEVDKATQPARNFMGSLFSRKYTLNGRVPQLFDDIVQKSKDLAQSQKNEALTLLPKVYERLNITADEARFINAAIEHQVVPKDPKAAEIWKMVNGFEPEDPMLRKEVWEALQFEKMIDKKNLKTYRASGIPLSALPGYRRHMLSKESMPKQVFRTGSSQETKAQLFAKYSTMVDDTGKRIPVEFDAKPDRSGLVTANMIVDGQRVPVKLQQFSSEKEIKRIKEFTERKTAELQASLKTLKEEITNLKGEVKGKIATKTSEEILKRLKDVPGILPADIKAITDTITKLISETDVEKVISEVISKSFKNGVKFSNGQSISKVNLDLLYAELAMVKPQTKFIASEINKLLAKGPVLKGKAAAKATTKVPDKELMELAAKIKLEIETVRKNILNRTLDKRGIEDVIQQVVAITSKNPAGLRAIINSLVTNKQAARDLIDEIGDIQRAAEIDLADAGELGGKFINKETGAAYTRMRTYVEEAKQFGVDFEDNSLLVSLASSYEAIKVSTARYFSRDIAKSFGVPASQVTAGMRPISSSGLKTEGMDISNFFLNKNGEELYFDPVIAEAVEGFSKSLNEDAASEAVKYYDKIQNYFKASVTSIWPAFHGRNAISNVFQMFSMLGSQVFNPAAHVKVASIVKGEIDFKKMQEALDLGKITGKEFGDYMKQTAFIDDSGYKWSRSELRSVIMDNMVAFHPRNLGQVDQYAVSGQEFTSLHKRLFPETKFDKMYQGKIKYVNPLSTDNAAFKAGFAVGQTVEDYSRLLTFTSYLKETGDVQQAAKMTKQVLFDYTNLSEFERRFMRRIFPFYTYSRKNIELQVKTLFKNPARVAGTIRSVYTLGDVMGNDRLTDEEKKLLPDWMKDGHNAVLSRENSHITVLSSLGIPIDQALSNLDPHTLLGMTTPLIKFPVEKMSGYSFFHGKPISEVTNAAAFSSPAVPEYIRDYIGFSKVDGVNKNTGEKFIYYTALRPDRMHTILNLPPTSRTWSYLRSMQDADLTTQAKIMGFLVGVKPESFDMQVEEARREKESKAELEAVLKQAGVGYLFTRYVLPDEKKEEIGFEE
jgi:hypothetical protein